MNKLYEAFWQKQEERLQKIKQIKFDSNTVYAVPLGGIGEIGMNSMAYHYKSDWIVVDFGNSFDKLYTHQSHIVIPSPAFFQDKKDKIKALVITHGHEDHIGAIAYIWESLGCPIYATPFTAALIRRKFEEKGVSTEHIHIIEPGKWYEFGAIQVKWILVTHSIPGSCMVAIRTEHGSILQTGDWKIDEDPLINETTDFESIKQLASEDLTTVICDSTNVMVEGRNPTEASVGENLKKVVAKCNTGRIFVAFFSTNVARLLSCIEAAKINGRKVGIVGRALQRSYEVSVELGLIKQQPHVFIENIEKIPANELLIACSGSQGELNSVLKRVATGKHQLLNIDKGDTVIFSSRVIPTNAKEVVSLENALLCRGVRIITEKDELVHTSGHARRDEIIMLYNIIQKHAVRKISILPCHGTSVFLDRHAELAKSMGFNTFTKEDNFFNGRIYELAPELKFYTDIEHEVMFVDGCHIVSTTSPLVTERQSLENGYISIAILMKDQGLANINVNTYGVHEDSEQLASEIRGLVTKLVRFKGIRTQAYQTIQYGVSNYLMKILDKKVRIDIHILQDKRVERRNTDDTNPKFAKQLEQKLDSKAAAESVKVGHVEPMEMSTKIHITADDLLV